MAGQILGAWLELQSLALVGATTTVAWFAREARSDRCQSALAAASEGREALLRETCSESDAGWARLVRFALRQGPAAVRGQEENYRVAPVPVASRGLARRYRSERWRLRLAMLVGIGCAEISLAVTALMLTTEGFRGFGLASGALSLLLGAQIAMRGSRASRALRRAFDALPRLLLDLGPPSPSTLPIGSGVLAWFERSSGWPALLLPLPAMFLMIGFFSHLSEPIEAHKLGTLLVPLALLSALLLAPSAFFTQTRVALDAAQQEIIVIRSLFSVVYKRIVLPIEIVRWFSLLPDRDGHGATPALAVDVGAGQSKLLHHEDAARIATELNQLLGRFRRGV
jgi:hypothetical protein